MSDSLVEVDQGSHECLPFSFVRETERARRTTDNRLPLVLRSDFEALVLVEFARVKQSKGAIFRVDTSTDVFMPRSTRQL